MYLSVELLRVFICLALAATDRQESELVVPVFTPTSKV